MYTIIKEINIYKERLEPAWEYPNPDDQWLFAETISEYVGTQYDVLYVYDDNTYKEVRGLKVVPQDVLRMGRGDLDYDETKRRLKKRSFFKRYKEADVVADSPRAETPKQVPVFASTTMGEKNALLSAKSYLEHTAFSYEGLIHQLEYEKYTHKEAVFAADHCGADWNKQALKSAKSYFEHTAFSYTGLIRQLKYEKFTTEQATYGADHCGANWKEQAVKSAKSYLECDSFSRDGLIHQLEYDGFTHEQAVYGVTKNGY